jgi:hypothetical protein
MRRRVGYFASGSRTRCTYQAALAEMTAQRPDIGASHSNSGTLNAAVVGYYQSSDFRSLTPGTQAMRPIYSSNPRHDDKRIATLPPTGPTIRSVKLPAFVGLPNQYLSF